MNLPVQFYRLADKIQRFLLGLGAVLLKKDADWKKHFKHILRRKKMKNFKSLIIGLLLGILLTCTFGADRLATQRQREKIRAIAQKRALEAQIEKDPLNQIGTRFDNIESRLDDIESRLDKVDFELDQMSETLLHYDIHP